MEQVIVKNVSGLDLAVPELHRIIPADKNDYIIPLQIANNYSGRLKIIQQTSSFAKSQSLPNEKKVFTHINREIKDRLEKNEPIVTFVMCLKNRAEAAKESALSIINSNSAKYFNFIIVEDNSEHVLHFRSWRYNYLLTHYIINTNDLWNRSKTLNYGFKRSRTPLVAAWDADFRFPDYFTKTYLKMIEETDFNKTYLWISTTETDATDRRGGHFEQHDLYGGFYTYAKQHVELLGGYDETFINYGHEERDFNKRLMRYFNTPPYRRNLKHIVYHKSHDDAFRGFVAEAANNLHIMQEHDKYNINVLQQKWGESELIRSVNFSVADTLIVLGNGPSLRNFDFTSLDKHGYHTIGMNAAYRFWYRANWFPTYHCCFDYIVTKSHEDNFRRLIENSKSPIKRHFLLKKITDHPKLTVVELHGRVGTLSTNFDTFGYGGCTGVNACQTGICLGYKKLILLGIDSNYVQKVDGAKQTEDGRLVMESTPSKNPNYFFDDYQQTGDKYNVPNAHIFHLPAWHSLAHFAKSHDIDIINCNEESAIKCFPKKPLHKCIKL